MSDVQLDITEVRTSAEVKVSTQFTGAPPMKAAYRNGDFLPDHVFIRYRYDAVSETWVSSSPSVSGPMILKPGRNGEQRLGKDRGKQEFYRRDVLPEWLVKLVTELTPTGAVTLPGV